MKRHSICILLICNYFISLLWGNDLILIATFDWLKNLDYFVLYMLPTS